MRIELEKPTLFLEDGHGVYLPYPNNDAELRQQTLSKPISSEADDRAQMPFLQRRSWEWIKPASIELPSEGILNPTATWLFWMDQRGLPAEVIEQAIPLIAAHYREWYGTEPIEGPPYHDLLRQTNRSYIYKELGLKNYKTLVEPFPINEAERQGARVLTQAGQGHKVILATMFYDNGEQHLISYLKRMGEWPVFADTPPTTIPPMVVRATRLVGSKIEYQEAADAKLLVYTEMGETAANLGMDLAGVDDDPNIIHGLTKRGYRMYTPLSIDEYRRKFRELEHKPESSDDLSDRIAAHDGFSSGLGKLSELVTNPASFLGTSRQFGIGGLKEPHIWRDPRNRRVYWTEQARVRERIL